MVRLQCVGPRGRSEQTNCTPGHESSQPALAPLRSPRTGRGFRQPPESRFIEQGRAVVPPAAVASRARDDSRGQSPRSATHRLRRLTLNVCSAKRSSLIVCGHRKRRRIGALLTITAARGPMIRDEPARIQQVKSPPEA